MKQLRYIHMAGEWNRLNQNGQSLRSIATNFNTTHATVSRTLKEAGYKIYCYHTSDFKDISNKKFGLITAIKPTEEVTSKGEIIWEAICDCQKNIIFHVSGTDLRRKRKTHCGCNFPLKYDISGHRFGSLTAIKSNRKRRKGHVIWETICDCGKIHFVTYGDLTSGHTKSCGCKHWPTGKDHHNWTGGSVEVKLYIRSHLKEWKYQSLQKHAFKCAVSGESNNLEVHHLVKPFISIFKESLKICNLKECQSVGEYSQKQLNYLLEECNKLHFRYGLGVPLTTEIHNKFHSIYGTLTTEKDFNDFKKGYMLIN